MAVATLKKEKETKTNKEQALVVKKPKSDLVVVKSKSDTKQPVVKETKKEVAAKSKNTKKNEVTKDQEKIRKEQAIEKYKNIPLGDLYNDLEEMKHYVSILNQRRDELIGAKSVKDPHLRKQAMKKTMDDTFAIKFKYQDASFRNHFVPGGLQYIPSDGTNQDGQQMERRMMHSQERSIGEYSNSQYTGSGIQLFRHENEQQILNRSHAGMERRELRSISDGEQQFNYQTINPTIIQRQAPTTMTRVVQQNTMVDRSGQYMPQQPPMSPQQPMPPQMFTQQQTVQQQQVVQQQQQLVQQQTTTTSVTEITEKDYGVKPIRVIEKSVVASTKTKLDAWPLLERIAVVIKNRKHSKILLTFIFIFAILSAVGVGFFLLWGFSIGWSGWGNDIGAAIGSLFSK